MLKPPQPPALQCLAVNISKDLESIRPSPTGKVGLEIVLPVEFKIWVEKCKYLEGMKEIFL